MPLPPASDPGRRLAGTQREWWRTAVLYQVYVRSFMDSDGDGIGDLEGIRSRLPYLRELGVDGIWLTPFYPSPGVDHGYDVADYVDVDPQFGSLADFDALVADAHQLDLRIVVDIVPNHTSSEHVWFRNAVADPQHPHRARYIFRPGRDGGPPNGWKAAFGGPAWTLDERSGEYYLHLFSPEQPDLDWHNESVRRDFEEILRFWLDRGVDGFRVDVGHALYKSRDLHDVNQPEPRPPYADWHTGINQPEVHELYRSWRRLADGYGDGRVFVGEIVLEDQAELAKFVRPDELQLAFNFTFLFADWSAEAMRATIDRTLSAFDRVGATATWVLENHDVTRVPTRYGGGAEGLRRARAAALLLLALPGTAFLYAGQELGLEEVELPDELRQDPIFFRTKGERAGRDGCRVPIPWTDEPPAYGFTTGEPWLPMPAEWASTGEERAAARAFYRTALELRRSFADAPFAWRESPPGTLAFDRGDVTCLVGFDGPSMELPDGELLLSTGPAPDGATWIRRR